MIGNGILLCQTLDGIGKRGDDRIRHGADGCDDRFYPLLIEQGANLVHIEGFYLFFGLGKEFECLLGECFLCLRLFVPKGYNSLQLVFGIRLNIGLGLGISLDFVFVECTVFFCVKIGFLLVIVEVIFDGINFAIDGLDAL